MGEIDNVTVVLRTHSDGIPHLKLLLASLKPWTKQFRATKGEKVHILANQEFFNGEPLDVMKKI